MLAAGAGRADGELADVDAGVAQHVVRLTAVWNGAMPWSDTTKTLVAGPAASMIRVTARSACW